MNEPLRPPSPYQNTNVGMTSIPTTALPPSYLNQMSAPGRAMPSPYRHSVTPSRTGPSTYDQRPTSVTPPNMDVTSSRRQSGSLYSNRGSPYEDGNDRRIITRQPSMESYLAAAAAAQQQGIYYSNLRGPLEAGTAGLATIRTTEDPFFKSDDIIEEKRPMKFYKVVIGMIVILILFAMYWIFVYPNQGFGTITKKRVEVAPNADMK